jgi:tRNA 5-methylaminomethyl-2-thiouridine biosynthesis bifunctional protein
MSKAVSASLKVTNSAELPAMSYVKPAKIDWQTDDSGNNVPVSGEFGDVYFSHADGLAESRYVFLNGNKLAERLTNLRPQQSFTVAELGFGTGLNLLALWQLWQQLRATQPQLATARLHLISTEKHPIALEDLSKILRLWAQRAPELAELIEQLLAVYPVLIAGCHRLNFNDDHLTVDLWLGDAAESLAQLNLPAPNLTAPSLAKLTTKTALTATLPNADNRPHVDAWFLDGFAPSCNQSLWADSIFKQIQRLSQAGTTIATYSCAGVVKRALQDYGFQIKKIKGFGRKNEMLTAIMLEDTGSETNAAQPSAFIADNTSLNTSVTAALGLTKPAHSSHSLIIGAGVSGLMSAWSLANRGIQVTLLDKNAPLSGASGNPRALLAPKMTPIHHADDHLHTIGYLYSCRLYRQLNAKAAQQSAPVLELTGALDLLIKANVDVEQVAHYPAAMATTLSIAKAKDMTNLATQDLSNNLYLPQAGLVNPQALKKVILAHPLISYQCLTVTQINATATQVSVIGHSADDSGEHKAITITADNLVICAAYESHQLDQRIFDCRKIRGQLSWFTPTAAQWAKLPKVPLKYSGYCAPFTAQIGDTELNQVSVAQLQLLLGASFVRNDIATDVRAHEHQISRDKLVAAIPELDAVITTDTSQWQARAGIRTQTPDYHPIVGQLATGSRIWTLTAMGAKGYAYAPICAEVLADMMLGDFAALPTAMLARLAPNRARLQQPLAQSV